MAWQERFYDVIAEMLRDKFGVDAVKVKGFEDRTVYGGYCETCAYEDTYCTIYYVDSHGYDQEHEFVQSFGSLIRYLDSQTKS